MRYKMLTLLALAVVMTAMPALAQNPGTAELGLFWRGWMWGHETGLEDNWVGGGGRIGYFFLRNLEIEGTVAYCQDDVTLGVNTVDVVPVTGRIVWNLPATQGLSLLLGVGYTYIKYTGDADADDDGINGLAGIRIKASDNLSLRLEGTVDRLKRPLGPGAQDEVGDFGVQAGVSWLFGGKPKDTDLDGVPDKTDQCADTPAGWPVDAVGCPLDTDGDGVVDPRDECTETPKGTKVDAKGCPVPVDSDGDGVFDPQDKCANTPKGTKVDANGCPVPVDSDGDGVFDPQDKCQNTPKGTVVDANGCPKVFEEGKKEVILEGVHFETAKAELKPESRVILDRVAESLVAYTELRVEVQGHTDSKGSAAYNKRLSQARADAVRDYLVGKGVAADRLTAKGYGEDKPIADNNTEGGRAQNRRVELVKID